MGVCKLYNDFSLDFIKSDNKDFQEMIEIFHSLDQNDPYKKDLYKDIVNLYHFIKENKEEHKPQIKLLNNLESGKITLPQLSSASNNIQDIYSMAYAKIHGISFNKGNGKKLLREQSDITAVMKAGSFIIEIDSIGKDLKDESEDMIEQSIDKYELMNNIMVSLSDIENQDDVYSFYEKYGQQSLKKLQEWFGVLKDEQIEFEYKNDMNNIVKKLNKSKIKNIYDSITNMEEKVEIRDYTIKGNLVGVNNKYKKITFEIEKNLTVTVDIEDNSLDKINLTTNKYYELDTKEVTKSTFAKEKISYKVDTLLNSSLDK